MRKSFKIVLFCLFFALLPGNIYIVVNHKNIVLLQFSIVDIMSLWTSVIIGFGLTYLVSVSFSKESKKNEIVEDALKDVKGDYAYLMQQFMKFRNKIVTDNFRNYILLFLKNIDKDILILRKLCFERKNMDVAMNNLIKMRSDFHYVTTDDDFSVGIPITDSFIEKCSEKYYFVKQAITQCKLELFNS